MRNSEKYAVVLVAVSGRKEGRKIASAVLEDRLAACVNITEKVESHYRWQGKIEVAGEHLLIIKTKKMLFKALIKKIKSLHSYEVPEIIFLPITAGDPDYLGWLSRETI